MKLRDNLDFPFNYFIYKSYTLLSSILLTYSVSAETDLNFLLFYDTSRSLLVLLNFGIGELPGLNAVFYFYICFD